MRDTRPTPLSRSELQARGLGSREIERALRDGLLVRLRRGWYGTPDLAPALAHATRIGGRLSCISALESHGAWVVRPALTHVRVGTGIAVPRRVDARLHWTHERARPGIDSPEVALAVAVSCIDRETLVAAVDSLLQRGILSASEVDQILLSTPRGRAVRALVDGAAESGIESLLRLRLRAHRIRLRSQVTITGVGRVDLLVGERLVVEVDGYAWHGDPSRFENDRRRDRELLRRGYLVMRASYRQVIDELDGLVEAILDVVRRREHRWRGVRRTELGTRSGLVDR